MFRRKKKRSLIALLTDPNIEYTTRAEAALNIAGLRDIKFFEPLVFQLINDPEPSVRMNCAYALGQMGIAAGYNPLMQALSTDGSEWVRGFCATALTNIEVDHTETEKLIINLLDRETDGGARQHFAHSLGIIGTEKSVDILTSMLNNDLDAGVRADSAEALGELGFESGYDVLLHAAENDISGEVRRQAFVAYKKIEEAR